MRSSPHIPRESFDLIFIDAPCSNTGGGETTARCPVEIPSAATRGSGRASEKNSGRTGSSGPFRRGPPLFHVQHRTEEGHSSGGTVPETTSRVPGNRQQGSSSRSSSRRSLRNASGPTLTSHSGSDTNPAEKCECIFLGSRAAALVAVQRRDAGRAEHETDFFSDGFSVFFFSEDFARRATSLFSWTEAGHGPAPSKPQRRDAGRAEHETDFFSDGFSAFLSLKISPGGRPAYSAGPKQVTDLPPSKALRAFQTWCPMGLRSRNGAFLWISPDGRPAYSAGPKQVTDLHHPRPCGLFPFHES